MKVDECKKVKMKLGDWIVFAVGIIIGLTLLVVLDIIIN